MTDTAFKTGDLVRFKGGSTTFTIDINPNPNYLADDESWADGLDDNFHSIDVMTPDTIELVMSADAASRRTPPTADEIVRGLNILGDGFGGIVDVDETDPEGSGSVLCFGTANNGLPVAFKVTVTDVERSRF